jgi:three-Cys-motif partner protein
VAKPFFNEQAEQSQVKTAIVATYFGHWAKVITGYLKGQKKNTRIAYIDLFAGPGRYEDGAESTPLLILEQAVADPLLRDNLVTIFNDKDGDNSNRLQTEIDRLDGVKTLKFKPKVHRYEVGEEIVKMFETMRFIPTLFFVDPWGYKGLSLRLINSVGPANAFSFSITAALTPGSVTPPSVCIWKHCLVNAPGNWQRCSNRYRPNSES